MCYCNADSPRVGERERDLETHFKNNRCQAVNFIMNYKGLAQQFKYFLTSVSTPQLKRWQKYTASIQRSQLGFIAPFSVLS